MGFFANLLWVMLSIVAGTTSSLLATRLERYIKKSKKQKKRRTKRKSLEQSK